MTSSCLGSWSNVNHTVNSFIGHAGKREVYGKGDAAYYWQWRQRLLRIRCGVSISSDLPFDIIWNHEYGEVVQSVMSELFGLSHQPTVIQPFFMTPQVWHRKGEVWSELFVPAASLAAWSGQFVCRIKWPDGVDWPQKVIRRVLVQV